MAKKSVALEADQIRLASAMVRLGARLQVLQAETTLSYDRLARLYREIRGTIPPKGMLPYSADWFMTWMPNIHASLFYSIHQYLLRSTGAQGAWALVEAYRLYLERVRVGALPGQEPQDAAVLSFTRAWMLIRFFDGGLLQTSRCQNCSGLFVTHAHDPGRDYLCGICKPPPRAGKGRARGRTARKPRAKHAPAPARAPTTAPRRAGAAAPRQPEIKAKDLIE